MKLKMEWHNVLNIHKVLEDFYDYINNLGSTMCYLFISHPESLIEFLLISIRFKLLICMKKV